MYYTYLSIPDNDVKIHTYVDHQFDVSLSDAYFGD